MRMSIDSIFVLCLGLDVCMLHTHVKFRYYNVILEIKLMTESG